jgi:hypothetical protein
MVLALSLPDLTPTLHLLLHLCLSHPASEVLPSVPKILCCDVTVCALEVVGRNRVIGHLTAFLSALREIKAGQGWGDNCSPAVPSMSQPLGSSSPSGALSDAIVQTRYREARRRLFRLHDTLNSVTDSTSANGWIASFEEAMVRLMCACDVLPAPTLSILGSESCRQLAGGSGWGPWR